MKTETDKMVWKVTTDEGVASYLYVDYPSASKFYDALHEWAEAGLWGYERALTISVALVCAGVKLSEERLRVTIGADAGSATQARISTPDDRWAIIR